MIGYIKGTPVFASNQNCVVLTAGGVGYLISLPAHTFSTLPGSENEVSFYICTIVREDAIELYGFETFEEKQTFEILRAISRVGARTALAILSAYRPHELHELVLAENQAALAKIPGIGAKTAQHIMLELRYKLRSVPKSAPVASSVTQACRDTLEALAGLGYSEDECGAITRKLFKNEPDLDVASAIRRALKELAKG